MERERRGERERWRERERERERRGEMERESGSMFIAANNVCMKSSAEAAVYAKCRSNWTNWVFYSGKHLVQCCCNGNPVGVRGQRGDRKIQGRQKMCRDRGSNSGLRN